MIRSQKANHRLHKILIITLLVTVVTTVSMVNVSASESDADTKVRNEIDGVIDEFKAELPGGYEEYADPQEALTSLGVKHILEGAADVISQNGSEIIGFLLCLIGVSLLASLTSLMRSEIGTFSSRAVGVISAALLFDRLLFLVRGSVEALDEIGSFFSLIVPVCLGVNSLGASPTTATAQALGMGVTLSIYSYVSSHLVLPLMSVVFVTSAVSSVDAVFGKISKGIRSTFIWVMGIFTAIVGATFSLQSVISSGADNAAVRSARYAISGTIPIVGGAVSGALGVLLGGIGYARTVVGGGAIAVIVAMLTAPLVTLLLYRIALKLGAFLSSVICQDGASDIISSFAGAIDVLIAAYTLTSLVYIVELVAFLKGGATGA